MNVISAQLIVGMEVHVQLATRSKMWSRAPNIAHPDHYDAEPNSLIDPVVLGLPGTLPVANAAAIEMAMLVGMALGCRIASVTHWDRKHYFYPDLPKGYQISQYDEPVCADGALEFTVDGSSRRVGIIRAHLEEDAGKLGHELPGGGVYHGSLVDYNRAGTPLLEIVTAPDMGSAADAVAFAQELRNLCRFLGVTEGVMQRGHMRFEPNINVRLKMDDGSAVTTPVVEVKNLNSFKSLEGAIEHEFTRQIKQWRIDGAEAGPGAKSTRGWDDAQQRTFLQRGKEDAHDYRYFPDPDLPAVEIPPQWRDAVRARLPELPASRRERYQREHGISLVDALTLTDEREVCEFYESCVASFIALRGDAVVAGGGQAVAKLLLNAGAKRANERGMNLARLGIQARHVAAIIDMRERGIIGSNAADELFGLLCDPALRNADPQRLAGERGWIQVRDDAAIEQWIDQAIIAQQQAAADFAAGKDAALGRLIGEIRKISGGKADASALQQRLRERLRPQ